MSHPLQPLHDNLTSRFADCTKFSRVIQIALVSGVPIIFYGPGGWGKSEMVKVVFDTFSDATTGLLECNPSTRPTDLFGGGIAQTQKVSETITRTFAAVDLDKSLIRKDFFFLEEVGDMPPKTQAALKTTLTQKGTYETPTGEYEKSQNLFLVGATNHDPFQTLKKMPPELQRSYQAFLDRFLLVQHGEAVPDTLLYRKLIQKTVDTSTGLVIKHSPLQTLSVQVLLDLREQMNDVKIPKNCLETLALIADASNRDENHVISPRNFLWSMHYGLRASAVLDGRTEVNERDFDCLVYFGYSQEAVSEVTESFEHDRAMSQNRTLTRNLSTSLATLKKIATHKSAHATKHGVSEEAILVNLLTLTNELETFLKGVTVRDAFVGTITTITRTLKSFEEDEIQAHVDLASTYPSVNFGLVLNEEGAFEEVSS